LLVGALQRRVPVVNIVVLGAFLASLGIIASAFTREVIWMSITLGAMYGLGLGMYLASVSIYHLMCFDKYKGTALSLTFIAWGVSGLLGPAFLAYLRANYALDGTLLMTGGVLLHAVPVSMLLKNPSPVKWNSLKNGFTKCSFWPLRTYARTKTRVQVDHHHKPPATITLSSLRHPTTWKSGRKAEKSVNTVCVEPVVAEEITGVRRKSPQLPEESRRGSESSVSSLVRSLRRFATEVFRTPAFYVFLIATVAGDYSSVSFSTTIVDYAVDKGIDVDVATHLVEFAAAGMLLGRIFIVPISDWIPVSRFPLFASSYGLEAICALALPHTGSFASIAALRVAETVVHGYSSAIRGILLAEYLGIERLASCSGLFGLVMVPVSLGSASIIGYFRDTMGSYDGFYRMLAALNTTVAVLLGIFIVFDWTRTRRRQTEIPGK
ncbi:hypothetical protein V5799_000067, partial [Amblyomma americanum]